MNTNERTVKWVFLRKWDGINRLVCPATRLCSPPPCQMSLETFKLHVQITVGMLKAFTARIFYPAPTVSSELTNFILIFIVFHGKGRQKHSHVLPDQTAPPRCILDSCWRRILAAEDDDDSAGKLKTKAMPNRNVFAACGVAGGGWAGRLGWVAGLRR